MIGGSGVDEQKYLHIADAAFTRIEDALADLDADDVDCERAGDVVTLVFKGGKRCVINTQRSTRQVWLAAQARAWHFSYDDAAAKWLDDKGTGAELFSTIAKIVEELAGIDVRV